MDTPLSQQLIAKSNLNKTHFSQEFSFNYIQRIDEIFASLKSSKVSRIELDPINLSKSKVNYLYNNIHDGNIDLLLSEFCLYQADLKKNLRTKWDIALLLTSANLFSAQESLIDVDSSYSTIGISPVNGIQWPDLSCSLIEFGDATSVNTTAYVAAHEIAHNIGIHHDGRPFNENCQTDNFIMSPNNGLGSIYSNWSNCSSESLDNLDLEKFNKNSV